MSVYMMLSKFMTLFLFYSMKNMTKTSNASIAYIELYEKPATNKLVLIIRNSEKSWAVFEEGPVAVRNVPNNGNRKTRG